MLISLGAFAYDLVKQERQFTENAYMKANGYHLIVKNTTQHSTALPCLSESDMFSDIQPQRPRTIREWIVQSPCVPWTDSSLLLSHFLSKPHSPSPHAGPVPICFYVRPESSDHKWTALSVFKPGINMRLIAHLWLDLTASVQINRDAHTDISVRPKKRVHSTGKMKKKKEDSWDVWGIGCQSLCALDRRRRQS